MQTPDSIPAAHSVLRILVITIAVSVFSIPHGIPAQPVLQPEEFPVQFDVPLDSVITSEAVTITDITEPVGIAVTHGEYSVNNGPFRSAEGTVSDQDQIRLRLRSPADYGEVATTQVSLGGSNTTWSIRTSDDPGKGWNQVPEILNRIQAPEFPDRDFPVTEFGAVGDGTTKNTQAFADAISACHDSGGGRVVVPAGEFLTGPIHLKSNVNLHLRKNAVIQFSRDTQDYLPVVYTRFEGTECFNYSPPIYAFEQENIAITGQGTLDGGGDRQHWWPWKNGPDRDDIQQLRQQAEDGVPVEDRVYGEGHHLRPNMIQPYRCENVLIDSVTIRNSPMWHIHPVLCENVTVTNVTVVGHGPNNDGCNPESSRDVLIDNCWFDTGDDCIAVKSGRNADGRRVDVPTENVIVQNCTMRDGHGGVVMGSEITGSARNIFARNCTMDSPNLERALRIKTNSMRGGVVEHVYFKDITIGEVADAVVRVNFHYGEGDVGEFTPIVRNITLENVTSQESNYALTLMAYERSPVRNLQLINCDLNNAGSGNSLHNVRNLALRNVSINDEHYHMILNPENTSVTSIEEDGMPGNLPGGFGLEQNYPNPFNGRTEILYRHPEHQPVRLVIYDLRGERVRTLHRGSQPGGTYRISWDGRDRYGRPVPSGVYFYELRVGDVRAQRRMVLVR